MHFSSKHGQSLIELIVAVSIGIIFIVGAIGALTVSLRLESQSSNGQPAIEIATELAEQLKTLVNNNWHNLDAVATSSNELANPYTVTSTESFYEIVSGNGSTTINGVLYRRFFTIEDVYRDDDDRIVENSGSYDPSTVKAVVVAQWDQYGQSNETRLVLYLSRLKNRLWTQTDWSSGPNAGGATSDPGATFTSAINVNYSSTTGQIRISDLTQNLASSNGNGIDAIYRYAWNDIIGWIDFGTYGNVTLSPNATTTGYASSSVGQIALDCATSPSATCLHQYGVVQDNSGNLSGFAWNDGIGWISFNCSSEISTSSPNGSCASQGGFDYKVTIDSNTGFFSGWAWNDIVGWISFNCDHTADGTIPNQNINLCASSRGGNDTSDYAVKTGSSIVSTAQLTSRIFDTGVDNRVVLNTITWNGSLPAGTKVLFQIASGNDVNNMENFVGIDGTSATYYEPTAQGIPRKIRRKNHANVRYIRYKIFLESDTLQSATPRVNDVNINYSL